MGKITEMMPYALFGGGLAAIVAVILGQPLVRYDPPHYEVASKFHEGIIPPFHTTYWVGNPFDPTLIKGSHSIIQDEGVKVLQMHSDQWYQLGFGDHIMGYGPAGSHADPTYDLGDRVWGQPPYYFGYVPGGPPDVESRPFTPAYWRADVDAVIKLPSPNLHFILENWIYYGLDAATGQGTSMTMMVAYTSAGLSYSFGNYPGRPYMKTLSHGFVPPKGYFRIHYAIDYKNKEASIQWADFHATVPLDIELVGYDPTWKLFNCIQITILEPGDLLVKSLNLQFWNKI